MTFNWNSYCNLIAKDIEVVFEEEPDVLGSIYSFCIQKFGLIFEITFDKNCKSTQIEDFNRHTLHSLIVGINVKNSEGDEQKPNKTVVKDIDSEIEMIGFELRITRSVRPPKELK